MSPQKRFDVYPFVDPSRFSSKLQGKVVLISGASSGIGRATAHAFAATGASVVCVARRQALLDDLVQELKSQHQVSALAIAADLLNDSSATAKRIVKETEAAFGPIDILINNAGASRINAFAAEEKFEDWWNIMRLNIEVPTALMHAVLPSMVARKSGILLSIASSAGAHDGFPMSSSYGPSKAAVIKFHQDLQSELTDTGISSFSLNPGNIFTDMVTTNLAAVRQKFPGMLPDADEDLPMLWQTAAQAAGTILALCADQRCRVLSGRYVNGEQDLEEVVLAAESGKIQDEGLYRLKMDEL